jgi:OOP family OmpA-OmpF porin
MAVATAEKHGIVDYSVTGHADRAGPEAYNLDLSLRRANAVRDALIQRGVKASGISVAGRGEAEPAVPTADGVPEAANRRVEIILL